jgi:hypothetical protein
MIKVAIIKPNHFNPNKFVQNDVSLNQFEQELKEYVKIVEIHPQDFMQTILVSIGLDEKEHGDTEILWEEPDIIYQMCFNYEKSGKNMEKEINLIASFLSLAHTVINGTVVVFCDKVNDQFVTEEHGNMEIAIMLQLFREYFYHQGLIVTTNNKIVPVEFDNESLLKCQDVIIRHLPLITESEKNIGTDGNMLDFNFEIIVRNNQHDNLPVNKFLSKLTGLNVKGDCLLKQKISKDRYGNLEPSLFKKILKLSEFDVKTRLIKKEEVKEEKTKNLLPIIKNRYYLIKNRLAKFKCQCAECEKDISKHYFLCGGCHRLKYCDQNCQKKNWEKHAEECKKSQECFNCKVIEMFNKKLKEEEEKKMTTK